MQQIDFEGQTYPLRFTLCFLTRPGKVLLLRRSRPPNLGLWNGVGGHIEPGEKPLASCCREVQEETGYPLKQLHLNGVLSWSGFEGEDCGALVFFSAAAPPGRPHPTDHEGRLAWKCQRWACTSKQVVDNLHTILPPIFAGQPPCGYHFEYCNGRILRQVRYPLSAEALTALHSE